MNEFLFDFTERVPECLKYTPAASNYIIMRSKAEDNILIYYDNWRYIIHVDTI